MNKEERIAEKRNTIEEWEKIKTKSIEAITFNTNLKNTCDGVIKILQKELAELEKQ